MFAPTFWLSLSFEMSHVDVLPGLWGVVLVLTGYSLSTCVFSRLFFLLCNELTFRVYYVIYIYKNYSLGIAHILNGGIVTKWDERWALRWD